MTELIKYGLLLTGSALGIIALIISIQEFKVLYESAQANTDNT